MQVHDARIKVTWAASDDLFLPDAPAGDGIPVSPAVGQQGLPGRSHSSSQHGAPDSFPRRAPSEAGSSEARFEVDPRELGYEAVQTRTPFSDGPGAPSPAVLAAMRRQQHQQPQQGTQPPLTPGSSGQQQHVPGPGAKAWRAYAGRYTD